MENNIFWLLKRLSKSLVKKLLWSSENETILCCNFAGAETFFGFHETMKTALKPFKQEFYLHALLNLKHSQLLLQVIAKVKKNNNQGIEKVHCHNYESDHQFRGSYLSILFLPATTFKVFQTNISRNLGTPTKFSYICKKAVAKGFSLFN